MGGASFASAELTDQSMDDRPAVQVGDPFLEKSLIEACLEAFKTGAVVAAQDMGAAGITCSTSEMAAKGGLGIELDLDKIPVRETGMTPYEYLLSESQERMLLVAQKGREQELIDIFERWGLQAVVAGKVLAEPLVRILHQHQIAAEVPASALADNTPIYHREVMANPPEYALEAWLWQSESLPECHPQGIVLPRQSQNKDDVNSETEVETLVTWNQILLQLLDNPSIASKKWVYRQYDHQVQNNTVMLPNRSDAAVIRVRSLEVKPSECRRGIAATTDCNSRYVYLEPYQGAKLAVAEAARNLSCVGAEPIAITDNLNFGSPEKPVGYWQLHHACRGIAEACQELKTPVTGGNVSLYNETLDSDGKPQPIYPTPVIGMVGLIPDLHRVCGQGWQNRGDLIYLLGKFEPSLGASEYLASLHKIVAGKPPRLDWELEKQVQTACREGIRQGLLKSAHDCAEGGIAIALSECCLSSDWGCEATLPESKSRLDNLLFGEVASVIIVSIAPENQTQFESFLSQYLAQNWQHIGVVKPENCDIYSHQQEHLISLRLMELNSVWQEAIAKRLSSQPENF
jgi:phosphoribosylformylglycinamidine synthase